MTQHDQTTALDRIVDVINGSPELKQYAITRLPYILSQDEPKREAALRKRVSPPLYQSLWNEKMHRDFGKSFSTKVAERIGTLRAELEDRTNASRRESLLAELDGITARLEQTLQNITDGTAQG